MDRGRRSLAGRSGRWHGAGADRDADEGRRPAVSGEPTFTTEVAHGRTIYRINGDLLLDPGHLRGDPVEAGCEYRFGHRGLEKVKALWEVRR